jgi:exopolysaccharide biosynthesis polyprenyl glycosylphosphotransferase
MQSLNLSLSVSFFKLCNILAMLLSLILSMAIISWQPGRTLSLANVLQIKLHILNVLLLFTFSYIWHVTFVALGLYKTRWLERGQGEAKTLFQAVCIGSILLFGIAMSTGPADVSWSVVLLFAALTFLLTWGGRALTRTVLRWLWLYKRDRQRLLLVGSNPRAHNFAHHIMEQPRLGYALIGYIDDPLNGHTSLKPSVPLKYLGSLQDFDVVIEHEEIDEVVISLPIRSCYERIQRLLEACESQGIQAHLLSDFFPLQLARARPADFDGIPLLTLSTRRPSVWPAHVKRALDLMGAFTLVLLLSPLFLLIAVLIKLFSPGGPVFFIQTRVGYNRRRFQMLKFRTMIPDAEQLQPQLEALNEAAGPLFKIKDDPRVTPIGRILRRLSLDELPQLFNVITGDMSLVGPRPLPLRDVQRFEAPWLKRRFSVKPGMTCLWQVNGRSHDDFNAWIQQDLEYVDQWSLGLDLRILARTIPVVLRGTGAH